MAKKKEDDKEAVAEMVADMTQDNTNEEKIEEPTLTPEMKEQIKAEIASHLKDHPPVVVEDSDDEAWNALKEQDERIERLENRPKKKTKKTVAEWISIGLTVLIVPFGIGLLMWDYRCTYGKWPWQKKS